MTDSFEPVAFGRYYFVDTLAVGGMAEVFKAKTFSEGGFEKLLCIKRILQHLSGNEEFVEMFIDEAKISVALQHPNIVPIYDFGKIRSNYFIAMELVEGKDVKLILRTLAERRRQLPPEYAAYIAHETCKGLEYAHKKTNIHGEPLGIIHRDISPSNILVAYNGQIKIVDFGIAKARISAYNTKDGVLKGKFEYMSPEQAAGLGVSTKSDIFCTGIILHEMLTGRRLFKTDSDVKTLEKVKAVDIVSPRTINPSVPARLDAVVMRALSKDPDDRFADAREMQAALMEFLYPSSPDIARESMERFMSELFAEEIVLERQRLDAGSRMAELLHDTGTDVDLGDEWLDEESASETEPEVIATENARPNRMVALGAILFLFVVLLGILSSDRDAPSTPVNDAPRMMPAAPVHEDGASSVTDSLAGPAVEPPVRSDIDADLSSAESVEESQDLEIEQDTDSAEPDEELEPDGPATDRGRRSSSGEDGEDSETESDDEEGTLDSEESGWRGNQDEGETSEDSSPPMGTVNVRVSGVGTDQSRTATLFVGDERIGDMDTGESTELSLAEGRHTIRVVIRTEAGEGILDESQTIVIESGMSHEMSF